MLILLVRKPPLRIAGLNEGIFPLSYLLNPCISDSWDHKNQNLAQRAPGEHPGWYLWSETLGNFIMSKLRVPPSVKMVLGWSRAWWGDHRHSKQHAVPKEIDEAEPDCEKGSSGQCDPCPTVCRALQKSSQPHGMLLHYSTNTIGSGGRRFQGVHMAKVILGQRAILEVHQM